MRFAYTRVRPYSKSDVIVSLHLQIGWSNTVPNQSGLPDTGFVRLSSIIAPSRPIPISKSTWWQGVKDSRFPKPVQLGVKTTAWRVEDIRTLIERLGR
jgi:prophage regulatory protein